MADKKIVWVACRASANCDGQRCQEIRHVKTQGGGHITHYRCLKCKMKFVVRV